MSTPTATTLLSKLERLKKLEVNKVELEYEIKADLLRLQLTNGAPVRTARVRLNADPEKGLSVRAAIVEVLRKENRAMTVNEIAQGVCSLLPDRPENKITSQVSVSLSSYSGRLFEKEGRGVYRLKSELIQTEEAETPEVSHPAEPNSEVATSEEPVATE